ncbi:MAG TPA: hypothetical protein VL528_08280 [Oxalicibacterium sp.]|jgi:hypothetical protein|nr:hypothetical protein [Oxalicibacterium sp.]
MRLPKKAAVIPAQAGIQGFSFVFMIVVDPVKAFLGSRLRGNDGTFASGNDNGDRSPMIAEKNTVIPAQY